MKTAYFDCFSGAGGNMIIGAFLDAGVPFSELEKELAKLNLQHEYTLIAKRIKKQGIDALYFDVEQTSHQHGHHFHHDHVHDAHEHNHHEHHHHRDESSHDHEQQYRNYQDIHDLITKSPLASNVKDLSLKILKRLGEAEAKVHQCSLNDVHFHEVGAIDTIVDIVGASFCISYLGIEKIYSSSLHTGSGMVKCAHGQMPIPAPATAELLKGASFYSTGIQGELLTPTGAAIITTLAQDYCSPPNMQVDCVAYGAGLWDLEIPNVLRLFIGQTSELPCRTDTVTIIETTIDDMNPELYGHIMDKLFEAGAIDVFLTPVYMKKNRPGILLTITSSLPDHQSLLEIIFKESSTLGIRIRQDKKYMLARESRTIETPYGNVRMKLGFYEEKIYNMAPEYEDCRTLAEKNKLPLKQIYQEALKLAKDKFDYK